MCRAVGDHDEQTAVYNSTCFYVLWDNKTNGKDRCNSSD